MIEWINRYSDTEESDKLNRWARIAYYKHCIGELNEYSYRLCYVSRLHGTDKEYMYSLSLYFPVKNYHDGYHKLFDTYQECQETLEKLFLEFINDIK